MRLIRAWSYKLQEVVFCLVRAPFDGIGDVVGEGWLQDDIVVEVVFEVLGAFASTMTVVYSEYLQFRPLLGLNSWLFLRWLNNVQDN